MFLSFLSSGELLNSPAARMRCDLSDVTAIPLQQSGVGCVPGFGGTESRGGRYARLTSGKCVVLRAVSSVAPWLPDRYNSLGKR